MGEPRKKRFYVSFSDTELAVVRTAAEREGMASAVRADLLVRLGGDAEFPEVHPT
ncbi:hypothetical protein [Streptomyces sp. NPDC058622]|uniref:hypothetical protein n=1 Tax=Streptomyces sp. NPDC058622 TaxID=3346562 RepID=UPI003650D93E